MSARSVPAALGADVVCALEGVGVTRDGRRVLAGVSFALRAGEVAGLIGANGAGKTTLLKVIVGLLAPDAGTIRRATGGVGYVPQKVLLDADLPLRARDVVGLGVDGQRPGLTLSPTRRRARRAVVDEMLAAVDATAFAEARVGELSGGQQQRILIAQALASRPRLLLLDEPLANLDLRAEQDVVALIGRVAREQGVGVLLSAHDVNPLVSVMDRVVYLAGGRAACGPTAEVVRSEVLSALYGSRVDVVEVGGRIVVVAATTEDAHAHETDQAVASGLAT